MKLAVKKNYQAILQIGALLASTLLVAYTLYTQNQLYQGGALPLQAEKKIIYGLMICLITIIGVGFLRIENHLDGVKDTQRWLINVVNWNTETLKDHSHEVIYGPTEHEEGVENVQAVEALSLIKEDTRFSQKPSRWPWGNHHTETLGHLEAAAGRFWRLYDSDDIGTAPTNEMVEAWLQEERGISKSKAKAIASMLRPDGLPTGPRR